MIEKVKVVSRLNARIPYEGWFNRVDQPSIVVYVRGK
jgi:hypothetical protein